LNADIAKYLGIKETEGVYIYDLNPRGAAYEAGLKKGDIITEVNGMDIKSLPQLQEQLAKYRPGDIVTFTVLRDGKPVKFDVKLKNVYGEDKVIRY
jgi:S1-C subfamily serine protease